MNKAINAKEHYKASRDSLHTGLTINLKNGKQVYAIFDHDNLSPYLITNEELISKLRDLANHIEIAHNA